MFFTHCAASTLSLTKEHDFDSFSAPRPLAQVLEVASIPVTRSRRFHATNTLSSAKEQVLDSFSAPRPSVEVLEVASVPLPLSFGTAKKSKIVVEEKKKLSTTAKEAKAFSRSRRFSSEEESVRISPVNGESIHGDLFYQIQMSGWADSGVALDLYL